MNLKENLWFSRNLAQNLNCCMVATIITRSNREGSHFAEPLRFLKCLKRGTSEEAKVSRRRSFWGNLGVQQQYDGTTTRDKSKSSDNWMFVFHRSVASGRISLG